jgi:hypothetical protein
MVAVWLNHQALSCQPHPPFPHPLQFSRLTINPLVDPIRWTAVPLELFASLNAPIPNR